ncbi:hypothetical protein [Flavihumibacter petaseus]|uniref:Uncharacterized protein n=1 Tax=Flavihumibacter petaseus NBRC 106054 TaxID=1220578 RepID=A0A0E9N4J8_9BACT|nr:hypothetical protein [Flavihumibacter petaseus]GAO44872.1 hypothetical protein FPE01S_04_01150 [Flavihumibacter petaseus NBRC 106054]
MHYNTLKLDHETIRFGHDVLPGEIYHIWSESPYFFQVFGQQEIRVKLGDYAEDRTAGEYGPVVFPSTELDFILQGMARLLLCEPPYYD